MGPRWLGVQQGLYRDERLDRWALDGYMAVYRCERLAVVTGHSWAVVGSWGEVPSGGGLSRSFLPGCPLRGPDCDSLASLTHSVAFVIWLLACAAARLINAGQPVKTSAS